MRGGGHRRLVAALGCVAVVATGCQGIAGLSGSFVLASEAGADSALGRPDASVHDAKADDAKGPRADADASTTPHDASKDAPVVKHDSGADASEASVCGSLQPPGPPAPDASGGTTSFVVALRSVDMGDKGDIPGYDLDKVDTCCDDAGPSCVSVKQHCDAPGGVDNEAAKIFQMFDLIDQGLNMGSSTLSQRAAAGKWTLLFQISDYNGEPDDFSVRVALFPSPGLSSTPKWDGTDSWPVSATAVGDGGLSNPSYVSQGAYVAGGVLVAAFPQAAIEFTGGAVFTVRLIGGVITGRLVKNGKSWELNDGVLAGRWRTSDVFASLGWLQTAGGVLCTTNPYFPTAKAAVCQAADLLSNAADPASVPCDSVSLGMGFTAFAAQLGAITPPNAFDGGCAPDANPATVTCQ
jgi:hypothetical protein